MNPVKARRELRIGVAGVGLRPVTAADRDAIADGIGDRAVAWMLARVPHPYTPEDADTFFAYAGPAMASGAMLYLAIEDRGRMMGAVSIEGMPGRPLLGYWLARSHWGRGIMPGAVAATLAYAFDTLGIKLVRSGVFVDNARSLRVQEKLGFRRIGHHRVLSLARGHEVEHIDTVLTPARFRERQR